MTDEMKNIVYSTDKHKVIIARAGCFPSDVEFWNGKRWKKINEYSSDDKVMEYDPLKNIFNIAYPIKYIKQKNSGLWYIFKLENNETIKVSDNHNMLCYRDNNTYYHCRAEEIPKIIKNENIFIKIYNNWKEEYVKIVGYYSIFAHNENEYCFTTNSGNLLVRYNGLIYVVGNCGKTTTLNEYIKQHTNEKILYLVYSASMKKDAERRFGKSPNCDVMTIHSYAYRWFLKNYSKRRLKNISYMDIENIVKLNKSISGNDIYYDISKIYFYYMMYLSSDVRKPTELQVLEKDDNIYLKYVEKVFLYEFNDSETISHGLYLKVFQLSKVNISGYDTILVDEFNDVSKVMLDIVVHNLDKKVIVCGDPHQAIMSFNFCLDGLQILIDKYNFKRYDLTYSFRIGKQLSDLCSKFLSWCYKDNINFTGLNKSVIKKLDIYNSTELITILVRTRVGGLIQALDILEKSPDKKIYFYGGLEKYGVKELENLIKFKNNVYINGVKFHIFTLIQMVKNGLEDPNVKEIIALYGFLNKNENCLEILKSSVVNDIKKANISIITLHSCKGMEFENVKLGNDIKKAFKIGKEYHALTQKTNNEYLLANQKAEINLLYVGCSRATKFLDISNIFKKYS